MKKWVKLTDYNIWYFQLLKFLILIIILWSLYYWFLFVWVYIRSLFIFLVWFIYAMLSELMHDTLHNTFIKWDKLNYIFGFIMWIFNFISYTSYKELHLHHHKYLWTDKDFDPTAVNEKSSMTKKEFFYNFFSINRIIYTFKKFITESNTIKLEYAIIFSVFIILIIIDYKLFIFLYIIPFIFIKSPINFIIQLPEHYKTDNYSKSVYENTREIKYSLVNFIITNGNNFHVTHHIYSNLPTNQLKIVNDKLFNNIIYIEWWFISYFIKELKSIFKTKTDETKN